MKSFDENILKIIDKLSYEFFVIRLNKDIKCVCIKEGSNQPDPGCKRCLGTGYKIKIKLIDGASQETTIPQTFRTTAKFIVARNYYIKTKYPVEMDDIIVDGDDVFFIYEKANSISFKGNKVYQKCSAITKKLDSKLFLRNFNEIVGR